MYTWLAVIIPVAIVTVIVGIVILTSGAGLPKNGQVKKSRYW